MEEFLIFFLNNGNALFFFVVALVGLVYLFWKYFLLNRIERSDILEDMMSEEIKNINNNIKGTDSRLSIIEKGLDNIILKIEESGEKKDLTFFKCEEILRSQYKLFEEIDFIKKNQEKTILSSERYVTTLKDLINGIDRMANYNLTTRSNDRLSDILEKVYRDDIRVDRY